MNPAGPRLHDIHPPPPPSWWPPAYGWWVLAVLVLAGMGLAAWWLIRIHRRRRRRRRLERMFESLLAQYRKTTDDGWLAAELSAWMRRTARSHDPRAVMLRGTAWHAFIDAHAPGGLDTRPLHGLEDAIYRPHGPLDAEAVVAAARAWVGHGLERERHA